MQRSTTNTDLDAIEWAVSSEPVGYEIALSRMEERVAAIAAGDAREIVWLLEHPSLYTAGTSAKAGDLLLPHRLPVHWAGRGGEFTYHGPGQRVAYVLLDLRRRFAGDVRAFVAALEAWIIATLKSHGVTGETRPGRIGVWVRGSETNPNREAKIAAIGVRVRRGVSFHGLSLNVAPDLAHYAGIVPCGLRGYAITSLAELGHPVAMKDVDISLKSAFERRFGPIAPVRDPLSLIGQRTRASAS